MHKHFEQMKCEADLEPSAKRQKTEPKADKYTEINRTCKNLQQSGILAVGLREVLKLVNQ
jgi:hypothetical protein